MAKIESLASLVHRGLVSVSQGIELHKKPDAFYTQKALQQLLDGTPPQEIFGISPWPYLSEADLDTRYSIHVKHPFQHNWRKKAMVNTLRAACSATIAFHVESKEFDIKLPQIVSTEDTIASVIERAEAVFDSIQPISESIKSNPDTNSIFETALQTLSPYFKVPADKARQLIAGRMGKESATRTLLPCYLFLLCEVYERDQSNFAELANIPYPSLDEYRQIAEVSSNILVRMASGTHGHLQAINDITLKYLGMGFFAFDSQHFHLARRQSNVSGFAVRLNKESTPLIEQVHREKYMEGNCKVVRTGCPSLVHIEGDQTLENLEQYPQMSLIHTVLKKSLND